MVHDGNKAAYQKKMKGISSRFKRQNYRNTKE